MFDMTIEVQWLDSVELSLESDHDLSLNIAVDDSEGMDGGTLRLRFAEPLRALAKLGEAITALAAELAHNAAQ